MSLFALKMVGTDRLMAIELMVLDANEEYSSEVEYELTPHYSTDHLIWTTSDRNEAEMVANRSVDYGSERHPKNRYVGSVEVVELKY